MNWINATMYDEQPEWAIGFIYCIEFEDGSFYIGKKDLFSVRKRNFGKKEIAKMTDKRLKTYEYVTKPSNWESYNGSSRDEVLQARLKTEPFKKFIVDYCGSKKELTYKEVQALMDGNNFAHEKCMNGNILGKFFKTEIEKWEHIKK